MRTTGELARLRERVRPGRLPTGCGVTTRPPRRRRLGLTTRRVRGGLPGARRRPGPGTRLPRRGRLRRLTRCGRPELLSRLNLRHRLRLLTGRGRPELPPSPRRLLDRRDLPQVIAERLGLHPHLLELGHRLTVLTRCGRSRLLPGPIRL
ncbi:hypothetical protein [Actinokineospora cianjurensis]|uniref:hypothetical protein n=1 Tax=Actinokineospora cianjurensis TaxID=585224 RepID=UPI0014771CA3|nr:hypothetical protein [Actinokineospora cianjurensis]